MLNQSILDIGNRLKQNFKSIFVIFFLHIILLLFFLFRNHSIHDVYKYEYKSLLSIASTMFIKDGVLLVESQGSVVERINSYLIESISDQLNSEEIRNIKTSASPLGNTRLVEIRSYGDDKDGIIIKNLHASILNRIVTKHQKMMYTLFKIPREEVELIDQSEIELLAKKSKTPVNLSNKKDPIKIIAIGFFLSLIDTILVFLIIDSIKSYRINRDLKN